MNNSRLLDTTSAFDAHACGYDRTVDPTEDGEGLIIETTGPQSVALIGPEGSVELIGVSEIKAAISALQAALATSLVGKAA